MSATPAMTRANLFVATAKRDGALVEEACELCGGSRNVVAHHDDYAKPLEVRWLCRSHHGEWHRDNVAANRDLPVQASLDDYEEVVA